MSQGMHQVADPTTLIKQILQRPEFADVSTTPVKSDWDTFWDHFWTSVIAWLHGHVPNDIGSQAPVNQIVNILIILVGIISLFGLSIFLYRSIRPRRLKPNTPISAEQPRSKTLAAADDLADAGAYPEAIAELFEIVVQSCITKNILQATPSATPYEYANALPKEPSAVYSGFSVVAPLAVLAVFAREQLTLEDWQLARSATQAVLESSE